MAIPLKLNELLEFEELTGQSFNRFAEGLKPKLCQNHRMVTGACVACRKADGYCKAHQAEVTACESCTVSELPLKSAAVLGWLFARRAEPELTYEEFTENADVEAVIEELGNQFAAARDGSRPSTAAGGQRSSTSTPGSRSTATASSTRTRGRR